MAKLTLSDLTTLTNPSAVSTINANSAAIETALENTLSRDGTAPNQMGADLDLNSYDLLNAGDVDATSVHIGGALLLPDAALLASDTDAITYTLDATGAVERVLTGRLSETASFADFGAVGDGVTDDTAAIQAAFTSGVPIRDTGGTFLITAPLTLVHPFNIRGAGTEVTVLVFDNFGGFAGNDGITISVGAGKHESSNLSDLTIAVKSSHGKYGITTPRGSAVFNDTAPRYAFERLVFRGTVEDGTLLSLYDYGWERCIDLGDSRDATIRDCIFMGCYDYTEDPVTANINNTAIYMSGVDGEGGVLMPVVDHCFIHYHGKALEFGYRVSNPKVCGGQFHRCYNCIVAPNAGSGTNYSILEGQFTDLNLNAQRYGVNIEESAFLSFLSVRVTRAGSGFDHADDWYGFRFNDTTELKMFGCRAYNEGTTYTNNHYGLYLNSGDYAVAEGMYLASAVAGGLTTAVTVRDMGRVAISGQANNSTTGVSFETATTNAVSARMDMQFASSVPTHYTYDAGVSHASITIVTKRDRYEGMDSSATALDAAGTTNHTRGVDKQVKRYSFAAGAGVYTHNLDFLNTNAAEGDLFVLHIAIANTTNPTVVVRDAAAATLVSFNNTTGAAINYRVEVVHNGSAWRVLGASVSLA